MALSDTIASWTLRLLGAVPSTPPDDPLEWGERYVRQWVGWTNSNSVLGWATNLAAGALAAMEFIRAGAHAMAGRVVQQANKRYRPNTVGVADAIAAWKTGHIDPNTAAEYMRLNGLSEDAIGVLTASAYAAMPTEMVLDLMRREDLSPNDASSELKAQGYTAFQISAIKRLANRTLGPSDLVTFLHREAFEEDQAADLGLDQGFDAAWDRAASYFTAAGLNREQARLYWRAGWNPISPTQAFDAWHRGAISESDVDAILRAHDYTPKFAPALKALSYDLPTLVDLRRGLQLGVLTRDDVQRQLERRGLSPDDAAWLTEFYVQLVGGRLTPAKRKELSTAAILNALDDGIITAEDAETHLINLRYDEDDAELLVQDTVYKRDTRILKHWIAATEDYYKAGDISDDEVRERLANLGVPDNEAHALSEKWIAARYAAGDKLTEAQIKDAAGKGILSLAEAVDELRRRGVTIRQIYVKLLLWDYTQEEALDGLNLTAPPTRP